MNIARSTAENHTAAPTGARKPLFIAINEGSGADTKDMPTYIQEYLREAGHTVTLVEIPKGADLVKTCAPLIKQALESDGIVIAAGGDGTVNAIAKLCYEQKATLGIIPLGTFNYFARALTIPTEIDKSLDVFLDYDIQQVSAGFVHDHLFLNNASFGLYPTIIRKREQATKRFGRKRIVGAISALSSLFHKRKIYAIKLSNEEGAELHRTSMVFVSNNSFQLDNLGLEVAECSRANRLAVIILKPMSHLQTAHLLWRGIVKNLKFENKLCQFCADNFAVETKRPKIEMVIDGEIIQCSAPLKFRVEPKAIRVAVPRPTETS